MGVCFAPPRLETFGPLVLAGRLKHHPLGRDRMAYYRDVTAQWQAFVAEAGAISKLPPALGYGVGLRMDDGATTLDYFCGFVVIDRTQVPPGFDALAIPKVTMAVVEHREHVSLVRSTIELIFATILPMAGIEPADEAIDFVQRYSDHFNPATGLGGLDVLVPVKV